MVKKKKKRSLSLNLNQKARFRECEKQVEGLILAGMNAGAALCEIREKRYYRVKYKTFASYCEDRFSLSRSYCNRLVEHHKTVALVQASEATILPSSVSQTKPMAKLLTKNGSEIADCWSEVILTAPKNGGLPHITEKHVQETVERWINADGPGDFDPNEVIPDPETVTVAPVDPEPEPPLRSEIPEKNAEEEQYYFPDDDEPEVVESLEIETMDEWNARVEEFCRGLVRFALENVPEGPWMDDRILDASLEAIKQAAATYRSASGKGPCPKCEGGTCELCRYTGFLPT